MKNLSQGNLTLILRGGWGEINTKNKYAHSQLSIARPWGFPSTTTNLNELT